MRSMTQGNDLHLVTKGNTTGTVKAAGDLVTMRGKADKRRDKNHELKKTKIAILGLRTTVYIQIHAGFEAQLES